MADGQLVFVDRFAIDTPKTKEAKRILTALAADNSTLVLIAESNDNVQRSVNNLADAKTLLASYLNIRDLLQYDKVIVPLDALDVIKRIWGAGE